MVNGISPAIGLSGVAARGVARIAGEGPLQQLAGAHAILLLEARGRGHLQRARMARGPFEHFPAQALGACKVTRREGGGSLVQLAIQRSRHYKNR